MKTPFKHPLVLACGASLLLSTVTQADDWSRWLGPDGSNHTQAAPSFNSNLESWKIAWKTQVGLGYSTVAVSKGKAFTMGHDGKNKETIYCFDASTGESLWTVSYEGELLPRMHVGGPNSSTTLLDDQLIAVSKDGQVLCLQIEDGKRIWKADLKELLQVETPAWGFASSPLVVGNRVFLAAGKVVALNLADGKPIWISETAYHPGYTSPVLFKNGDKEYVAALDGKGLTLLQASNGKEIARHPLKAQFDMIASTPVVSENGSKIFISCNMSSELLGFGGKALTSLWTSRDIRNAMNNSVIQDGVIYGVDGRHGSSQTRLVAIDLATGNLKWAKENFGYGTAIGVGNKLLALTEAGDLVLTALNDSKYEEISRRSVLEKTCWTNPVYANQRIYVRNDQGQVICLSPL